MSSPYLERAAERAVETYAKLAKQKMALDLRTQVALDVYLALIEKGDKTYAPLPEDLARDAFTYADEFIKARKRGPG